MKMKEITPGEILLEEFMKPLNLTQYKLAKDIGVAPLRISQITHGHRRITPDTALRLAKYFSMTPQFWMNVQSSYDLRVMINKMKTLIKNITPISKAA